MDLAVLDLIAIIMTIAGLVASLSVLYAKFIKPIKKVIKQVEENRKNIALLDEKIAHLRTLRDGDNAFSTEVRSLLLESLMAILEAHEKTGCNGNVSESKKKINEFLRKQL
jgi:hypothetical protein